jgi:hypothetical protein
MADDDRDPDIAFIRAMTDGEMRDALVFLSGYSPDGFASVKARVLRERERGGRPQREEATADG